MIFENYTYDHLNHFQIGRIGEYWVKILLTLHNLDVYTSEVDNKGIDFIIRVNDTDLIDIQVKTIRVNTKYVFVTKKSWNNALRSNLYLALVMLNNNSIPATYLIPATAWNSPNELLKDYDYAKEGQKSKPEWGINISSKTIELLEQYELTKSIAILTNQDT